AYPGVIWGPVLVAWTATVVVRTHTASGLWFMWLFIAANWALTVLVILAVRRIRGASDVGIPRLAIIGAVAFVLLVFAAREGAFSPLFSLETDWYSSSSDTSWSSDWSSHESALGDIPSIRLSELPLEGAIAVTPYGEWEEIRGLIEGRDEWVVLRDEEGDRDSVYLSIRMPAREPRKRYSPFLKSIRYTFSADASFNAQATRGEFDWDAEDDVADTFASANLTVETDITGTVSVRARGFISARSFDRLVRREVMLIVVEALAVTWRG
ncbi:MAG: hypothetical protein MI724_01710, partial [Spirochaetales bacterium]|nr:hypothetical protein [Spirochaetales bacterium]